MKLFNDGQAWLGLIEITFEDFCRAEGQQNLNAFFIARGFNPYYGYYSKINYLKQTIICQEK